MSKRLKVGLLLVAVVALSVPLLSVAGAAPKLITGADVQDDSLTGADIQESSLGQVPSAAVADRAALSGVQYVEAGVVTMQPGRSAVTFAVCPLGKHVLGGGHEVMGGSRLGDADIGVSRPGGNIDPGSSDVWMVGVDVPADGDPVQIRAVAVCADRE